MKPLAFICVLLCIACSRPLSSVVPAAPASHTLAFQQVVAIEDSSFAPATYVDATGFVQDCTLFIRWAVVDPGKTLTLTPGTCAGAKLDTIIKLSDLPWIPGVTCWFTVTPSSITVKQQGEFTTCSVLHAPGVTTLIYALDR